MTRPSTDQPVLVPVDTMCEMLERHPELPLNLSYIGADEQSQVLRALFLMCTANLGGMLEVKPHDG